MLKNIFVVVAHDGKNQTKTKTKGDAI